MKDKGTDIIRINSIEYENWKTFLEDKKSDKSIIERMGRKSGEKIGRTIFGFDFICPCRSSPVAANAWSYDPHSRVKIK
jgi:hypothetical protein